MDIVFGMAQVGDKTMAPKETIHRGKSFRRCGVWVDDPFGEPLLDDNNEPIMRNGKQVKKKKSYQLIFGSGPEHAELFKKVKPGRRVFFLGRVSDRARVTEKRDDKPTRKDIFVDTDTGKKYEAWANITVHVMRLEFIDPPLLSTVNRFMAAAVEAGKLTEDEAKDIGEAIVGQLSNRDASRGDAENGQGAQNNSSGDSVPPSDDDDEEGDNAF